MVQRNMTFIYHKEYDIIRIEYGNIVNESIIMNGTDATVNEVCNVYTKNTVPNHVVKIK